MPGYKKHTAIGIITVAVLLLVNFLIATFWKYSLPINYLDYKEYIIIIIVGVVYALLPDIDTPASKARFIVTFGGLIAIIYYAFEGNMNNVKGVTLFLVCVWLINYVPGGGHRGFVHSIWFAIIVSAPLWFLGWHFCVIGFIGYCSHLIADELYTGT